MNDQPLRAFKYFCATIVAFCALGLGYYAIYKHYESLKPPVVTETKEVKICAILPLTGFMSSFGEQMREGQDFAKDLIDSGFFGKPNFKIYILFEDSKADPKEAVNVYKRMRMSKVNIFTTTLSPVALSLIPLVKQENVLLFADAAHPSISNSGQLIFRHSNTAPQEAQVINEYLKNLPVDKVAIAAVNDDYGEAFCSSMEKIAKESGKKIVQVVSHPKEEKDFRLIATKLLQSKPDAVIICSVGAAPGLIVKELKAYKFRGFIIATNTFGYPEAKKAAGTSAKGVSYIAFDFDRTDPLYKSVNEEFKSRYGKDMSDLSLIEFNTIFLLWTAINQVGEDVEKISTYIRGLKEFNGIGETLKILPSGDILPRLKIITVR
jgi:branched-chain amino acid transport system substrate-binding protein